MLDAGHLPVMPTEVLEALAPAPGQVIVDCTAGRGGHAELFARAIGATGTLVLFDTDAGNLSFAQARVKALEGAPRVFAVHARFELVGIELGRLGLRASGLLADLGFASTQMDDPSRGFAFSRSGPLDMRLDASQGPTAADLLAGITETDLADLIFELGEDPFARRIARSVVERRRTQPLRTTQDLAEAVVRAYGPRARHSRMHPATRTFMALRIAVNRELECLDNLLDSIDSALGSLRGGDPTWLAADARVAFLSFHSLEDRSIKRAMVDWERLELATRLTRKPMVAGEAEQLHNPRARSAKLRAALAQPRRKDAPRQDT
jgi:16S rRNA (cytosine1402-N4)-methyltransferase